MDFQEQKLHVPKIGWVPCIFHRRFEGRMKTVTISIEPSGEFHVSILVENEDKTPVVIQQGVKDESDVLGIDMGVKDLCTCSDGTVFGNNRYLAKSEKRLRREQRRLSRKKKGSANRNKQKIKVAEVNKKIADQRKDTIEKATAEIAGKSHAAVAVENLCVKGMVENHHLAKSVSDASMSTFLTRLYVKEKEQGEDICESRQVVSFKSDLLGLRPCEQRDKRFENPGMGMSPMPHAPRARQQCLNQYCA